MFETLEKKVQNRLKEMQQIIKEELGLTITVSISYDLKSVRTLGYFEPYKNKIVLNKHLLIEFGDKYIEEVLVHEFCHAVVNKQYPSEYNSKTKKRVKPHGTEFKYICSLFGIKCQASTTSFSNSEVLKDLKKNKKPKKRFIHSCNCGEHKLSTIKHNKILRGINFICNNCKTKLDSENWKEVRI